MQADKIFEALASGARRQILAYLSKAELTTSELAAKFEMTAPSMSCHLSVLENAGLVTSKRTGQRVIYQLTPDSLVNTLTGFALETLFCRWTFEAPVSSNRKAQVRRSRRENLRTNFIGALADHL